MDGDKGKDVDRKKVRSPTQKIPKKSEPKTTRKEKPEELTGIQNQTQPVQKIPEEWRAKGSAVDALSTQVKLWYVFRDRPPSVPKYVYERYSASTRREHVRWLFKIRTYKSSLPFETAVVELVLEEAAKGNWSATTLSRTLGTVKSALAALPVYTNQKDGILLPTNGIFDAALRRAQRIARAHVSSFPPPLTEEAYNATLEVLRGTKSHTMLLTMWLLAARASDVRSLKPADLEWAVSEEKEILACTYTGGKGVFFRGAYTSKTVVEPWQKKEIKGICGMASGELFGEADQRKLAAALKQKGFECRSVRKGRLCLLAEAGIPDDELMQISGHTSKRTLHRYLRFGRSSATSTNAALQVYHFLEDVEEDEEDEEPVY